MKKKLGILITAVTFITVACLCIAYDAKYAEAGSNPDAVIMLPDDALMLVLWETETDRYMLQRRGPATFTIENNKLWHNGKALANNMNKTGYGIYVWQEIPEKLIWNEECQCNVPGDWSMSELELEPIGADDLPHSQHIAKLIGIDQQAAKPAIVARKFLGEVYTVNCLVSQSAFDMYLVGDLEIGDYVIVSFIDEIPDTTELNIAIVVDKVVETW